MVGKDKPKFHTSSHHVTAITFLMIGIIITTGILSVFTPVSNQNTMFIKEESESNNLLYTKKFNLKIKGISMQ